MTRLHHPVDSDLDTLLERGRSIRRLPDVVRARALTRARAAIAAAARYPETALPRGRGRAIRIALAASIILMIGAAGAGAALLIERRHRLELPVDSSAEPVLPPPAPEHSRRSADPTPAPAAKAGPARPAPAITLESYAAELALLQRVQAAYIKRDYLAALALVAEHGRRFPNGRLAEEREAFRIRSLAASGRSEEARRATAAFGHRFPRSVLLPRLRGSAAE